MLLLAAFLIPLVLAAPSQNYVNTAVARTIELGGATTSSQTQYSVKSLVDSPGDYWLALSSAGGDLTAAAWWEVSVGGKAQQAAQAVHDGSVLAF
jgi:oligosaccharyltransferase complex subunit alpha (ribophorin I)